MESQCRIEVERDGYFGWGAISVFSVFTENYSVLNISICFESGAKGIRCVENSKYSNEIDLIEWGVNFFKHFDSIRFGVFAASATMIKIPHAQCAVQRKCTIRFIHFTWIERARTHLHTIFPARFGWIFHVLGFFHLLMCRNNNNNK